MAEPLSWQTQGETLFLQGELDRVTLLSLWEQRENLLQDIHFLDVSRLDRVDSAGVAMLLHLYALQEQRGVALTLTGVTEKLRTLIALYKLDNILPCADDSPV
ncbi:lipid asymmetry maintenance protein MlaB [Acerihabitans sp. TG2]|uniref:lipid asymmetry maintenance protein MlaB n=1 Tax=Acerihabitans sp. TG2 TaxID=3096008 RepID=UPI002B229E6A|nr:lipid asymmetry maintenance protein MlaB [Acerihabitans sp. TG2]MEA9390353.1 lipid asymmetry maintenance protein MlaB [Acerihabitans sp. TG2]